MEFLYKIYGNQYFAVCLFSVIAFLLVLFVIVLIAAIKDTKKRKIEMLDQMEKEDLTKADEKVDELPGSKEEVAFEPNENKESLEFYKDDENSTTRDIKFDEPIAENSMSDLLKEFDDVEEVVDTPEVNIDELLAEATKENDAILNNTYEIELPKENKVVEEIPVEVAPVIDEPQVEEVELANEVAEEPVEIASDFNRFDDLTVSDTSIEPSFAEPTEQDDFELPAIKEDMPAVVEEEINKDEIDFSKTGVLDFSNIETESYEIK